MSLFFLEVGNLPLQRFYPLFFLLNSWRVYGPAFESKYPQPNEIS